MKKRLENLENCLMAVEGEINGIRKKIIPLEDALTAFFAKKKNLQDEYDDLTIKSFKKLDWNYILFEDGRNCSNTRYQYRDQQINKIGLTSSGYISEIQQVQIRVMLSNGDLKKLKQTKKALEKVLPYIKFVKNEYKRIGIMERSCSASGVYELLVSKGMQYLVIKTAYGREEKLKRYNTLDEALQYIHDYIYYNRVDAKGAEIYEESY